MKTIDAFTLTPKQQRFCDEYLIDMNATRAALRAGYTQATAMNGQLMEMPKIQAYLKERTAEAAQKLQVSHETLLGELMKVAFANMGDYFGDDGRVKAMQDIVDDKKSAIWSLKVSEGKYGTTVQLRLHNKLAALEKIAKHIKFYEVEQKKPEPQEAVYVDKEDLNDDDRFEDDSIDALDKDLYEKKVKLETLQRELYLKERDLKQREADLAMREMGVNRANADAGHNNKNGVATVVGDPDSYRDTNNGGTAANTFSNPGLSGRKLSNEVIKERRQQYLNSLPPKPGQKVFF
ncbi:terminase small subunit [uncultured Mucilaginibacter sp.]|uniref:terminase small subunit n=1 Tax=uncultured Mucilaginibacter sp. TaxID=797541 RepID=UPI0025E56C85|nr:terminase small subunit [uncultured Mucilaginibacter sp.]